MKKEFLTLPNRVSDMLANPGMCEMLIGVLTYENHEKDIEICRDFSEIPEDIEEVNYNKNHSRAERRRRTRNIGAKRITLAKKLYNEEKTSDERFVGRLKDGSEPLGWKHEYRFWDDMDAERWLNRKQVSYDKSNDETAFNNFLDKEFDSYEENDEIMAYNRLQEAEAAYAKAMQRRVDAAAEMKSAQFYENKAATEYYVAIYEYSKF